ncbi:MAG: hypothetical protein Q8M24_16155 [Pseudolabrys sp.]|nr:hypothetical protein [Pseudolabrys sp.]MDP2296976.1 hypothetical protein [Pseudolabrys sp.]
MGGPAGWRFQIRLPASLFDNDFRLSGPRAIIRVPLGPRGRGEARRLAQRCATLCQTVFALAAATKEEGTMTTQSQDQQDNELARQVIAACQSAIARAVAQPSQAIGLAHGLDAALTSLRLVQTEVGKGERGARAVVDNAEALTRNALKDVLAHAADPKRALEVLATTSAIAPVVTAPEDAPVPPSAPPPLAATPGMPRFSDVSEAYIKMRIENDGEDHPQIPSLRQYQRTFLEIVGDRPVDQYYPSDLQHYVSKMQRFPTNATKRSEFEGKSTLEIIEANQDLALQPLRRKTLSDGYVAFICTMMRNGMADFRYRDPFAGVQLRWPKMQQAPVPREGISLEVLDRVFQTGVASGCLDEALLPLLSALTSRRLGMGAFLRGADIREKYGVMVAQTSGVVFEAGQWIRIPVKTDESAVFYVLHNFLSKIGFVDWARKQDGWIFAAAHEHPDPAKYLSKVMNRLLRRCGANGGGEVFHSLRGDAIDAMRSAKVQSRTRRLQAGHELGDVHEKYGHRALKAEECKRLAIMPLPKSINWKVFDNLDFDALAAKRRGAGRPRRGGR